MSTDIFVEFMRTAGRLNRAYKEALVSVLCLQSMTLHVALLERLIAAAFLWLAALHGFCARCGDFVNVHPVTRSPCVSRLRRDAYEQLFHCLTSVTCHMIRTLSMGAQCSLFSTGKDTFAM